MPVTYQAETPLQALLLEQALVMARKIEQAASSAPDGRVLADLEAAAVPASRELARLAVQSAAQAQADEAEKRGRARASALPAPARRRTRAAPRATS
jgi:hypothetical protein